MTRSIITRTQRPHETFFLGTHTIECPLIAPYKLCHRPRRLETSNLYASIAIFPHIMSQFFNLSYRDKNLFEKEESCLKG